MVSDASGNCKKYYDYVPFGEEIPSPNGGRGSLYSLGSYPSAPDIESQKFTGKERDAESGLDYFEARYFSAAQGRFTSADAHFADQDVTNPQGWNLYGYVRNNPVTFVDLTGHSTHTDNDGNVVAVYPDRDLGVYKHDDLTKWNGKDTLANSGDGISRMGETEYWDEFRNHDVHGGFRVGMRRRHRLQ